MFGTILLLGMAVCGYLNITPWILIPGAMAAAFMGLHYPSGKAQLAKERGVYWQVLVTSLPLQAILVAVLYGLGWGVSVLVN